MDLRRHRLRRCCRCRCHLRQHTTPMVPALIRHMATALLPLHNLTDTVVPLRSDQWLLEERWQLLLLLTELITSSLMTATIIMVITTTTTTTIQGTACSVDTTMECSSTAATTTTTAIESSTGIIELIGMACAIVYVKYYYSFVCVYSVGGSIV